MFLAALYFLADRENAIHVLGWNQRDASARLVRPLLSCPSTNGRRHGASKCRCESCYSSMCHLHRLPTRQLRLLRHRDRQALR